ncbi:uncharacterized protein LOC117526583 [Thalassophryne amazonica]|uniref:uncharacterized protein LOC117526583 n=1 Tax=Thalassophryne amazonica TaxID=390379 RepID=UPI001471C399|nr:uncharacterized protein LOC117526583 [Thalassophryne amazonica]
MMLMLSLPFVFHHAHSLGELAQVQVEKSLRKVCAPPLAPPAAGRRRRETHDFRLFPPPACHYKSARSRRRLPPLRWMSDSDMVTLRTDTVMDAEAQREVGPGTGRGRAGCVQLFLLVAVILLFLAVSAVAAGGVLVVMELRHELETSRTTFKSETAEKSTGEPEAPPAYKMQNFAYLRATFSELQTSTMTWAPVHYGEGISVGSHFIYDKDQHYLHPKREGTYFIYLDLHFNCTYNCNEGHISMHVGDKLSCEVRLPAVADERPVSKKCWTVTWMDGTTKLSGQMTVRPDGPKNWKLDVKRSGLGMILVD